MELGTASLIRLVLPSAHSSKIGYSFISYLRSTHLCYASMQSGSIQRKDHAATPLIQVRPRCVETYLLCSPVLAGLYLFRLHAEMYDIGFLVANHMKSGRRSIQLQSREPVRRVSRWDLNVSIYLNREAYSSRHFKGPELLCPSVVVYSSPGFQKGSMF